MSFIDRNILRLRPVQRSEYRPARSTLEDRILLVVGPTQVNPDPYFGTGVPRYEEDPIFQGRPRRSVFGTLDRAQAKAQPTLPNYQRTQFNHNLTNYGKVSQDTGTGDSGSNTGGGGNGSSGPPPPMAPHPVAPPDFGGNTGTGTQGNDFDLTGNELIDDFISDINDMDFTIDPVTVGIGSDVLRDDQGNLKVEGQGPFDGSYLSPEEIIDGETEDGEPLDLVGFKPLDPSIANPSGSLLPGYNGPNATPNNTVLPLGREDMEQFWGRYDVDLTDNFLQKGVRWFKEGSDGGFWMDLGRVAADTGVDMTMDALMPKVSELAAKGIFDLTDNVTAAIIAGKATPELLERGLKLDDRIANMFNTERARQGFLKSLFSEGYHGPTMDDVYSNLNQINADLASGEIGDEWRPYVDALNKGTDIEYERWVPESVDPNVPWDSQRDLSGDYNSDYTVIQNPEGVDAPAPIETPIASDPTSFMTPEERQDYEMDKLVDSFLPDQGQPVYDEEGVQVGIEFDPIDPVALTDGDKMEEWTDPLSGVSMRDIVRADGTLTEENFYPDGSYEGWTSLPDGFFSSEESQDEIDSLPIYDLEEFPVYSDEDPTPLPPIPDEEEEGA